MQEDGAKMRNLMLSIATIIPRMDSITFCNEDIDRQRVFVCRAQNVVHYSAFTYVYDMQ